MYDLGCNGYVSLCVCFNSVLVEKQVVCCAFNLFVLLQFHTVSTKKDEFPIDSQNLAFVYLSLRTDSIHVYP